MVQTKVVRNTIADSVPAVATMISILQTNPTARSMFMLMKNTCSNDFSKFNKQVSRKAEPHQCGDIADTLWRAPRSLTRLWLGFRLSRSPFRTCLTYPVGVGRSAKTPTCESLCAGFRFKSHRRTCLWRCGWVAFLLGVLTRSTRRKRNPAHT